jgi:hypothetical protein
VHAELHPAILTREYVLAKKGGASSPIPAQADAVELAGLDPSTKARRAADRPWPMSKLGAAVSNVIYKQPCALRLLLAVTNVRQCTDGSAEWTGSGCGRCVTQG